MAKSKKVQKDKQRYKNKTYI